MKPVFESRFGCQLFGALPEVYRTRDITGDLANYLDSFGLVLDAVYASLEQRLRDSFPETCQEWLIPYFAQLLDVDLVSPHLSGQRAEVSRAVLWRKAKGTLGIAEEIARKVGNLPAVKLREGWQRVALTARVGDERQSAATIDFRRNPRPTRSTSGTGRVAPNRVPRFPGGFDDNSRRSVDLRTPDWRHGHWHPKTLALYAPPPTGFFAGPTVTFTWRPDGGLQDQESGELVDDRNPWVKITTVSGANGRPRVEYRRKPGVFRVVRIKGQATLNRGQESANRAADASAAMSGTAGGGRDYLFSEINLVGRISVPPGGRLILERLAARSVSVETAGTGSGIPALSAIDCLLGTVRVARGLVRLEYCTVLKRVVAEVFQASDCILLRPIEKDLKGAGLPRQTGIRYSAMAPAMQRKMDEEGVSSRGNCTDDPLFHSRRWGAPGCGVLHPAAPEAIRHGAEDGSEMGAFHHRYHVLAWEAVLKKLAEYLPFGIVPVLVPDARVRPDEQL